MPSTVGQRSAYVEKLCSTLNQWTKGGPLEVRGHVVASADLGVGIAVLEKAKPGTMAPSLDGEGDLLSILDAIRQSVSRRLNTLEIVRGVKLFEGNRLYIVKPISQRYWTRIAALNDADEIAGTILMHAPAGAA